MRCKKTSGASLIEFTFALLVLVPLILGVTAFGLNMVLSLQTVQLARDAGHMFAKAFDFSQAGNKSLLASLGSGLGLSATAGAGNAVVVLSSVKYVDKGVCAGFGLVDSNGNPLNCTNYQQWVFVQRLLIGNQNLYASSLGAPITTGKTPVTLDSSGTVSPTSQEATNAGDVAVFTGLNPFVVAGNLDQLPSGQMLYVGEAAAKAFVMPPYAKAGVMYSYTMF
ncbi:MAG: hypothetical protein P4L56_13170 [Candidatus Sulfopaludibacter sp.]|nr:hypothetical protein [Candidatus Sulfopaludibacter sp.]